MPKTKLPQSRSPKPRPRLSLIPFVAKKRGSPRKGGKGKGKNKGKAKAKGVVLAHFKVRKARARARRVNPSERMERKLERLGCGNGK